MKLETLLKILENYPDRTKIISNGFTLPHLYKGIQEQIAVVPISNITIGSMLECVKECLNTEYKNYKCGYYAPNRYTECVIAYYQQSGKPLTREKLNLMLSNC